jgi:hypothetical protein
MNTNEAKARLDELDKSFKYLVGEYYYKRRLVLSDKASRLESLRFMDIPKKVIGSVIIGALVCLAYWLQPHLAFLFCMLGTTTVWIFMTKITYVTNEGDDKEEWNTEGANGRAGEADVRAGRDIQE